MPEQPDTPSTTHLVVGVTGHRKLRDADIDRVKEQVRAFFLDLQARYPETPLLLLSPLAEGADGLVADVAFELGLRVIAPLPLPVELYREDFDEPGARERFEQRLARAEVLVLPLHEDGLGSPAVPGAARDRQYAEAGFFVSRHCHVLLALWDGRDQESLGGTSHVVRFHLHGDLPGQISHRPAALNLLGIDENTLVRHIPVSRRVAPQQDNTEPRWLTSRDGVHTGDAVPEAFDRMFRNQADFNADIDKYADEIDQERRRSGQAPGCPIHRLFMAADWMARTYQQRVARVLRVTYVLAAATGAAFILYAHVHSQDAMIYLYLLLFGAGVILAMLARRREWHRKYLDYRALAEGLRVQSYWRRSGVVDIANPSHANENFMQEQDVELGWIRNVMRAANLEGLLAPMRAAEPEVDAVIDEWIGTSRSDGQLRYFTVTAAKRARHHRQAEFLGHASLALGIGISVILALFAHQWGHDTKTVLVVAMGLLSVGAGVHEAYAHKKADKELVKQYRFMERIYGGARRRLDTATTVEEKREILRVLGEAALAEHAEWTLMHRERPLEHTRLGG
ncbi:hypothetical protein [Luteimonas vadosa]|uniref:SMODS and SLOG-associating 2TM effector domain-containing protein n=1 Tax=Luteimonas vadosa TaxID=1165507 RepID=A0ABP9DY82_9GAMM